MPATAAQIAANQQNAQRSTGPKTPEGKAASRANSFQHGLTGQGVVLEAADQQAVDRRFAAFAAEFEPRSPLAIDLTRQAAILVTRLDRCARHDEAHYAVRVRAALATFDEAHPVDPAAGPDPLRERARDQAADLAQFDPGPEAERYRRYELATERALFRTLAELRLVQRGGAVPPAASHRPAPAQPPLPLPIQPTPTPPPVARPTPITPVPTPAATPAEPIAEPTVATEGLGSIGPAVDAGSPPDAELGSNGPPTVADARDPEQARRSAEKKRRRQQRQVRRAQKRR